VSCTNNVDLTTQYPTMHTYFINPRSKYWINIIGVQNFPKIYAHSHHLDATQETGSKFHTQDQQMLHSSTQNLVTQATWRPGFLHLCNTVKNNFQLLPVLFKSYLKLEDIHYSKPLPLAAVTFLKSSTSSKIILLDNKTI
jgi:hypothetical protein